MVRYRYNIPLIVEHKKGKKSNKSKNAKKYGLDLEKKTPIFIYKEVFQSFLFLKQKLYFSVYALLFMEVSSR